MRIWRYSVAVHKLRYTSMISDGDSSTYPTIAAEKPYGPNHVVKKMECVGYVQKRMYAHLKEQAEQRCGWKGRENGRKGEIDRCGDEEASEILWPRQYDLI